MANKVAQENEMAALVRYVFGSSEGQSVLNWMERLHCHYKFQSIVQSPSPNAALALAYKAGKADVVIELRDIINRGFEEATPKGEFYHGGRDAASGVEWTDASSDGGED